MIDYEKTNLSELVAIAFCEPFITAINARITKMNNVEIEITKIVNGGYGLGRLPGGQVILVRHSLPNESHIVTVSNEKKNLCYGSTRQILVSNSERRPAPCPYYHDCGGCDLQHCHYPYQTAIKKSILIDMLARLGNGVLKNCVVQIQPVLAASEEFHYRQRIRLQIGKRGELGFNRFRSNTITPISACLLAAPPINVCLSLLREKKEANSLLLLSREIELQYNPGSGRIFAIFYLLRKPRPADNQAAKKLTESSPLIEAIYFAGSDFSLTTPTPQRSLQEAVGREKSHQPKICYPTIEGLPGPCPLAGSQEVSARSTWNRTG
jgi:23S rRNA (uracil1939-C5)-methyltransferase